jgi:type VI secretion system protein ImpE
MNAEDALRQGDPEAALRELQAAVRKAPGDAKLRVFLFQLLAVMGDWDRALAQLNVAAELDAGALGMAATYRDAVQSEPLRERIFRGDCDPLVFGPPQRWIALMVEALRAEGRGDIARAQGLRAEAFESAPAVPGQIDGLAFGWIADADQRLGPVLEGIVNGRYSWIPFMHVSRIRMEEPADLRDLVWAPAQVTWSNGGESIVLIPVRYPGTAASGDPRLRLARRTEWLNSGADSSRGLGQRMLTTDVDEYPLLQIRDISLQPVSADADGAASDG